MGKKVVLHIYDLSQGMAKMLSMQFLGKASLISLMLPYFFLGAASLRESSAAWPNGRFFMFFVFSLNYPSK